MGLALRGGFVHRKTQVGGSLEDCLSQDISQGSQAAFLHLSCLEGALGTLASSHSLVLLHSMYTVIPQAEQTTQPLNSSCSVDHADLVGVSVSVSHLLFTS